jgi:hypothetical protein
MFFPEKRKVYPFGYLTQRSKKEHYREDPEPDTSNQKKIPTCMLQIRTRGTYIQ